MKTCKFCRDTCGECEFSMCVGECMYQLGDSCDKRLQTGQPCEFLLCTLGGDTEKEVGDTPGYTVIDFIELYPCYKNDFKLKEAILRLNELGYRELTLPE